MKKEKVDRKFGVHISARKVALSGIMLALALIVSLVESYIPPIVPMLPYAKLGLTNVVLLACFLLVGVLEGYIVLVIKCVLSAVYAGNMSMLIWSLPSALVAYTVMVLLSKTKIFSITGLSVSGGMLHNLTQIVVATIVVGKSVFFYLPYMLFAGGIAGLLTGIICHFAVAGVKGVVSNDFKKREEVEEDGLEDSLEDNPDDESADSKESEDKSNLKE